MKGLTACFAILALVGILPAVALGQNVLTNPGFENGLNGWIPFGNAYAETSNPPQFVPYAGNGLVSMFGNFTGEFNVTGIFQEFPTVPGKEWNLSSKARHFSGDRLVGQVGAGNWVVQKIVFKDAGDFEIGGASVESVILDGTYATDVWHDSGVISGVAPAGTVQIEAFILYLQPLYDGGAAHIDNVELTLSPEPVALDIHPGSCPNPLSLAKKGLVPVAVLGTDAFDVGSIDMSTLRLEGVAPKKSRMEDVGTPYTGEACECTTAGADGYTDLVMMFPAQELVSNFPPAAFKDKLTLTLTGNLDDGTAIVGQDCVVLIGGPTNFLPEEEEPAGGPQAEPLSLTISKEGPGVRIEYVLPEPAMVSLRVFDVSGRVVDHLVQAFEAEGTHTIDWSSASRPSGVYFYQLTSGDQTVTRKVALLQR